MMGHNTENLTRYLDNNFYVHYEGSTQEVGLEERLEYNQKKEDEIYKEQDTVELTIRNFPFYILFVPAAFTAMTTGFMKTATYLYNTMQGKNENLFSLEIYHTLSGLILGAAYAGILCFNRIHAGVRKKNLEESLQTYKQDSDKIRKALKEFR